MTESLRKVERDVVKKVFLTNTKYWENIQHESAEGSEFSQVLLRTIKKVADAYEAKTIE